MKLLACLFLPVCSIAQFNPEGSLNKPLVYKATIISDSGVAKGYFVAAADSSIILSTSGRYLSNTRFDIPIQSIRKIQIRNKTGINVLGTAGITVLGFILTAGFTKNNGDVNHDGKTSFWESLFAAIEGATSGDRRRRNTAILAGAAGGTAFMVFSLWANKKLSIRFPLNNRNAFYNTKRAAINKYVNF